MTRNTHEWSGNGADPKVEPPLYIRLIKMFSFKIVLLNHLISMAPSFNFLVMFTCMHMLLFKLIWKI